MACQPAPQKLGHGTMYHHGEGVAQNYDEAVKLYRMAADQGYAGAQYNLGVMYASSWGLATPLPNGQVALACGQPRGRRCTVQPRSHAQARQGNGLEVRGGHQVVATGGRPRAGKCAVERRSHVTPRRGGGTELGGGRQVVPACFQPRACRCAVQPRSHVRPRQGGCSEPRRDHQVVATGGRPKARTCAVEPCHHVRKGSRCRS